LPANERAPYLDKVCAGDPALRQAIESLLKSHEQTDSLATTPAKKDAAGRLVAAREPGTGNLIGRYRIISMLGEGGMGRVYLAEDTKLHRKVPLKFLSTAFSEDLAGLHRLNRRHALSQRSIIRTF